MTELVAQSRKDLIWEYKKLIRNDSHLGVSLTGDINDYSNSEISAILDSAWIMKKSIILMQILGYLPNPECVIPIFGTLTPTNALLRLQNEDVIAGDLNDLKPIVNTLNQLYLTSKKNSHLSCLITKNALTYDSLDVLLITYKNELEMQLWVKKRKPHSKYLHLKSFKITDTNVANLGPKSKRGDNLTPEGFYSVDFYPALKWSDYYLAFRIPYPNDADIARRKYWGIEDKSGGDINIHGCCISIGCVPIGNPDMEELFLLIRANQKNGSVAHILIFPFKFHDRSAKENFFGQYRDDEHMLDFWQSLEKIQQYLLKFYQIPAVDLNPVTGYYEIN